jgi:arsenate reductase
VTTVIFACVHGAGRSQMAAGFFNALAYADEARAVAAGSDPAERVHPEVVQVMREAGVDLTASKPRRLTDELAKEASLVVTMGCGEACPFVPGLERVDWTLPDPKGLPLERVRAIRDEIRRHVAALVAERGWTRSP